LSLVATTGQKPTLQQNFSAGARMLFYHTNTLIWDLESGDYPSHFQKMTIYSALFFFPTNTFTRWWSMTMSQ